MNRTEYLEHIAKALESGSTRAEKTEKMLQAIEKELEGRDIADVSTESLIQCRAMFLVVGYIEDAWKNSCLNSIFYETEKERKEGRKKKDSPQNKTFEQLGVDAISLHVGHGLLSIFDPKQDDIFAKELGQLRKEMVEKLGYVFPDVRILDSVHVGVNEYVLYIHHRKVASGQIYLNRVVVFPDFFKNAGLEPPHDVIVDVYPPYEKIEAHWYLESSLPDEIRPKAEKPSAVVCQHIKELVIQHADELFTHLEAAKLVSLVDQENSYLIQELTPALISITTLREVIAGLIRERVSIRDILYVFECIAKHAHECKDSKILLERVRCSLGKTIVAGVILEEYSKCLHAISLPTALEADLKNKARSPEQTEALCRSLGTALMKTKQTPQRQTIICPPEVRLEVFQLMAPTLPDIAVLTLNEIPASVEIIWLD